MTPPICTNNGTDDRVPTVMNHHPCAKYIIRTYALAMPASSLQSLALELVGFSCKLADRGVAYLMDLLGSQPKSMLVLYASFVLWMTEILQRGYRASGVTQ